jgi:hypothetical protein
VKIKEDSSLQLTVGSIFSLLKLKNSSSILEKMQSNCIFLGGTDDWIYKILHYKCLWAICKIPWGICDALLPDLFGQGGNLLSPYNGETSKSVFQSREYPLNNLNRTQKCLSEQKLN